MTIEELQEQLDCGLVSECPACGGLGSVLGILGNLVWFRCQNCGIDFKEAE